jgi:hypothetical protein
MAAPDMPSMRLAAEAYNVYFAYYHDAPAWDKHSGETKVSAEVKAASS